jgi:uncharacterized membrane protein YecN with MAPEG domain
MDDYRLVAIVTLVSLLLYFYMSLRVGQGRSKFGIAAPATSGHPDFDRLFRVHANTLEWLPIFLVSLWLFAVYWNEMIAAAVGAVWVVGRIFYALGYYADANRRGPGFLIQSLATGVLLFGALGKVVYSLATGHV